MILLLNPFEQFYIQTHSIVNKEYNSVFSIFNHYTWITDTNIINIFVIGLFVAFYINLSSRRILLDQSYLLIGFEALYLFVYNLINTYLPNEGRKYFPFFLYLFIYICINNLIGILPYSFTTTSHLSVTFSLSFTVWFGCTIIGFSENGTRFFSVIFPRGIPFAIVPFLVAIELISYIFRSVSLALRLFANIVAGHILLDTLALFLHKMIYPSMITITNLLIAILPFIMCIVLILFEMVVALLQGYIFVVLSCIYLKDVYSAQNH